MEDNKVEEAEVTQPIIKTDEELAQEFMAHYRSLCDETGLQIFVLPEWKARDDGTFSLIQTVRVGRQPKT